MNVKYNTTLSLSSSYCNSRITTEVPNNTVSHGHMVLAKASHTMKISPSTLLDKRSCILFCVQNFQDPHIHTLTIRHYASSRSTTFSPLSTARATPSHLRVHLPPQTATHTAPQSTPGPLHRCIHFQNMQEIPHRSFTSPLLK